MNEENRPLEYDSRFDSVISQISNKFANLPSKLQFAIVIFILLLFFILGIFAHKSVAIKKEDYNNLQAEILTAQNKYESKEKQMNALQSEYDEYKSKMEPYESVQLTDAKNKAEKEAKELAEKRAAEEKAAAEAKAKKEAEEKAAAEARAAEIAKGYETGITFDNLARTPNEYIGKKVKFKGKVLQVIEADTETQIRLAVNGNYDTVILCRVPKSKTTATRILEDDYIHIMGVSNGLISYQSTLGGTITIPDVSVDDWGQN